LGSGARRTCSRSCWRRSGVELVVAFGQDGLSRADARDELPERGEHLYARPNAGVSRVGGETATRELSGRCSQGAWRGPGPTANGPGEPGLLENPTRVATVAMGTSLVESRASARSRRSRSTITEKVVPSAASCACNERGLTASPRATEAKVGGSRSSAPTNAATKSRLVLRSAIDAQRTVRGGTERPGRLRRSVRGGRERRTCRGLGRRRTGLPRAFHGNEPDPREGCGGA
jgi:hypothetical protein